jgi:hypothetical protein
MRRFAATPPDPDKAPEPDPARTKEGRVFL